MNIFKRIFGKDKSGTPTPSEHAVIVHFQYGSTDLQLLFDLEGKLEAAINSAGVGELDGNEVAQDGSDGYLYLYGPHADRLFEVILPILEECQFTQGAEVRLRYGPAEDGVRETVVNVGPKRGT